jgi:hypothetical protein
MTATIDKPATATAPAGAGKQGWQKLELAPWSEAYFSLTIKVLVNVGLPDSRRAGTELRTRFQGDLAGRIQASEEFKTYRRLIGVHREAIAAAEKARDKCQQAEVHQRGFASNAQRYAELGAEVRRLSALAQDADKRTATLRGQLAEAGQVLRTRLVELVHGALDARRAELAQQRAALEEAVAAQRQLFNDLARHAVMMRAVGDVGRGELAVVDVVPGIAGGGPPVEVLLGRLGMGLDG